MGLYEEQAERIAELENRVKELEESFRVINNAHNSLFDDVNKIDSKLVKHHEHLILLGDRLRVSNNHRRKDSLRIRDLEEALVGTGNTTNTKAYENILNRIVERAKSFESSDTPDSSNGPETAQNADSDTDKTTASNDLRKVVADAIKAQMEEDRSHSLLNDDFIRSTMHFAAMEFQKPRKSYKPAKDTPKIKPGDNAETPYKVGMHVEYDGLIHRIGDIDFFKDEPIRLERDNQTGWVREDAITRIVHLDRNGNEINLNDTLIIVSLERKDAMMVGYDGDRIQVVFPEALDTLCYFFNSKDVVLYKKAGDTNG